MIHPRAIQHYEDERSNRHIWAARELVEDHIAPNIQIARELIQFMAISEGLDSAIQRTYRNRALTQ